MVFATMPWLKLKIHEDENKAPSCIDLTVAGAAATCMIAQASSCWCLWVADEHK